MGSLRLITLGALRLVDGTGRDVAPGQRKLLALLAYLARRAPRAATRDELAALMWGERREENARASLRQALFQLKRMLGDVLDVTPESAALRSYGLTVDASVFEREVTSGQHREAALRWNGDFLRGAEDAGGGAFRVWLEGERARLRRLLMRALEALTAAAADRGAWSEGIGWAERWAETLPLEERPHRRLVELLSLAGRDVEALARHADYVARVRAEFDSGASDDFLALAKQLERRVRGATPAAGSGVVGAVVRPPEMVGRQAAFAELTGAWVQARHGQPTVVVIEGDAGLGKSRLADELVRTIETARARSIVLHARAYDTDRDVPFAAARELLAPLSEAPGLLGSPRTALAELARVVPSVRDHVTDLPDPSDHGRALDEAVARVVSDVSAEVPMVIVVDDLPKADAASRRLVLSLPRRLERDARVLLVLTARAAELGQAEELRELRHLHRIRLEPLEPADVEALVASMVKLPDDSRRPLAERLAAESAGVPGGVVDAVAAMVDDRQLVHDGNGGWRVAERGEGRRAGRADFVSRALRGRYVVDRMLFKGGVLTTYAAADARRGRQVELHVPARRVATAGETEQFVRTFERVSALGHPGILPVIDYGAAAGVLYFVTPPVEVQSLRERIASERRLSATDALDLATGLARALAHAHARGVHHQDLRPKHVLVTPAGVLVARLGLAEALTIGAGGEGVGADDTGVLIGAPAYLSPEQLAGEGTPDARSDIYSFGCILYEMLAGEPPFGVRGRGLLARKLTEAPPSLRATRGDLPEPLDALVGRCLARAPADRHRSADDLLEALGAVQADLQRLESTPA